MLIGLVNHLPGHRVRPHVLCLKDAGPLAPECHRVGVPVFEGLLRFKTDAAVITRIRRIISEHAIDSVTIAHSGGDRMFWGTLAAGLSALPVVVWSHWFPTAGHRHFERPNRALYRCVDAFVALGERHRRALVRHEHLPAGRIAVIPNAVDLAAFMHATPRKEARRRLRLDVSQVGVAIIANLRREKRHDVFIEAAHRLAPANPRLRFFIIGDGPCRDAVQAAAAASGLDHETLRLLGPRDDVPVLLSGLDISCLCSEVECFSVSMLEAAAAGCAFIGPAVGCMPEYLKHRQTGFLIEAGSPGALADAIGELADNAALRQAMAREAKKKAIQRFGFERLAGEFADLLQSLGHRRRLAHRRARRADVLVEQPAGDAAPLFQA
jgi:glycosyltransferase involved in cell wall biosynthesis